jgi:8-oxo-dGTP diphosphatase
MVESGREAFMQRLERALAGGLRLVQVREKTLAPDELQEFATAVIARARARGARVLVNGSFEVAARAGADGVHLSAAQLMAASQRPDCDWCGASCHDAAELSRARELGVDFVVLGPVAATPSHPRAQLLGWRRLEELIRDYPLPVYAIGGMQAEDLEQAWRCGAQGVAMLRGAWSDDKMR